MNSQWAKTYSFSPQIYPARLNRKLIVDRYSTHFLIESPFALPDYFLIFMKLRMVR